MKKIAYCFLIYDIIEQEELWYEYFKNVDSNKYNIYIHSKENPKLLYFNDKLLSNCIPTKYGAPSQVLAHNLLFKKAYDDDNYKIISLSQSCIPFKSFDYIYEYLTKDNYCRMNMESRKKPDQLPPFSRGVQSLLKFYDITHIQKADNWFVLNRKITDLVTSFDSKLIEEQFKGCASSDEH